MSALAISMGLGQAGLVPRIEVLLVPGGQVEILADSGTLLQITVSGGTPWDGVYPVDVSGIAAGPVSLLAPVVAGTGAVAQTLARSRAGLWLYDPTYGLPDISQNWQADVLGNGIFSGIGGANGTSYVLTSAEAGDQVRLAETATQANGGSPLAATAFSADIDVAAPPSVVVEYVGETHSAGNVFSGGRSFSGVIPNDAGNSWTYYAFLSTAWVSAVSSVSIAGVSATLVRGETEGSGSSGSTLRLYRAVVPAGTGVGNFGYTLADFVGGTGLSVFRARGHSSENATGGTTNTMGATISLNQNVASGDRLIGGSVVQTPNDGGGGQTWTGLTSQHWDEIGSSAGRHAGALNTSPAGGSPMVLSVRPAGTDVANPHGCAIAVRLS
jgi:hypothetical protein